MFKKLLIANRGEIALRVVRACRELGITAVAVYSEADRQSLHVRHADEAYLIGGAPAQESYLNIPRILEVARRARVEAVHPGYGFLAENAAFAEAVRDAGITFVGPSPESIRLMGDKVQARRVMQEAGLPVVPGTEELTSEGVAVAAATGIGYPILIKATAGGGGRGIRTVYRSEELPMALEAARQEAASAFGHGALYMEKFLEPVRHVEVQIIADGHGNVVSLGERECSIQRRHQKMIEEAPAIGVGRRLRARLREMAVAAVRAVGYENVGTLEFLIDRKGNVNFLEMNTRLQVEHPVTEMVTGVDLVADQIKVAAGEPLAYRQSDVQIRGWAIECRVATEDPFNSFLPSVGTVSLVTAPGGPGVRVDSALYDGLEISYYYDPLIAKLCTWGRDRTEAIQRMRRALREFKIVGVSTNIPFHLQVMENLHFQAGRLDTGFVEKHFRPDQENGESEERVALLAAALLAHRRGRTGATPGVAGQRRSDGWRLRGRPAAPGRAGWAQGRGTWRNGT
ncbi:MAG TPA: acetyl-CoA carboxylase biotin carboxylase subunit [Dehalococcoidia bacterium]|nr:acetyl-CoA carboxylase biotin carboxylase subunit [Dehalococcoidia bacterium]